VKAALSCVAILFFSLGAHAFKADVDFGVGYSLLDLKNPNNSTARSTGAGGSLGAHYGLFGNENYSFGLKGSLFYSQLKNDANSTSFQEKTDFLNYGLGFELAVHNFFVGWQYKYTSVNISISGNMNQTSKFTDYMPQFEVGYIFHMDAMSVRLLYQRIDGTLSARETGLSSDTDLSSSAFMVILRFSVGSNSSSSDRDYYKGHDSSNEEAQPAPYVPNYRSYRYAPRPSPNIR
jgi:hypothetical protein